MPEHRVIGLFLGPRPLRIFPYPSNLRKTTGETRAEASAKDLWEPLIVADLLSS